MPIMKWSRFNIVIVKSLRGTIWKTLLAIRSVGKVVILAAFFVHAGAWVIAFNVDVSFNSDLPVSIFGQRVNEDFAEGVVLATLLMGASSLMTLAIFIPLVLIDLDALAKRIRSILTRKIKEGFCAACGYNLTGNVSGTCPECGTAMHAA